MSALNRTMKPSGVDWIGDIPTSWEIARLKYLLSEPMKYGATESGIDFNEDLPRYIRITDISKNRTLRDENKLSLELAQATNYMLRDRTILFARSGATVGKTFLYKENEHGKAAFAGYLISACNNPEKVLPEWIIYFSDSHAYDDWVSQVFSQATLQNIGADKYSNMPIPTPRIEEQKRIISFLDERCGEIDGLVGDIEKQIDILERYKQSVISEAVTKGLDPTAPMKSSGVDWIGDIPKAWKVCRIKYLFEICKRIAGVEGYDVLSITQKGIRVKDLAVGRGQQLANDYSSYQFVYPDDFAMNHMDLLTGWVDLSKQFGVTSPDYRVFRAYKNKGILNVFYKYVFQNCYSNRIFYHLGNGVSGLGRWRLQTATFKNFLLPVPPFKEQQAIADYLDKKCAEIDALIATKREQLEKLAEYKKSLIYEYVTGKKGVCYE